MAALSVYRIHSSLRTSSSLRDHVGVGEISRDFGAAGDVHDYTRDATGSLLYVTR